MLERLKTNTFRLAVVGEFSSGKSTFLNAIIGKDILKHGVQERQQQLPKFKIFLKLKILMYTMLMAQQKRKFLLIS